MDKEDKRKEDELVLTPSQQKAFDSLVDFIRNKDKKVFILKGYAGTGKTTLMKELIKELRKRNERYRLLASTGRAAKILSDATGMSASTIHSMIYKFTDLNQDLDELDSRKKMDSVGQLLLMFSSVKANNENYECLYYIVDESSMISDTEDKSAAQAMFGNGRLLNDLMNFDFKGKFIFVGDECQLPPVFESFSPALSVDYFKTEYNIDPSFSALNDIVRQNKDNDITKAAMQLRLLYETPPEVLWAKFPLRNYKHIKLYNSQIDLIDAYIENIKKNGYNNATILCRSNSQCTKISNIVRSSLNIYGRNLQINDLLLVTQNNYISGLMNGDLVKVTQVGEREMKAGLTFINVEVENLFSNKRYSQRLIEDILFSATTNLQPPQQKALFIDFHMRMKSIGIKQKTDTFKAKMMEDPYLNAIRAVMGYALTCHKAQGGEWNDVYIDIPKAISREPNAATYQWLYTAITRARGYIHIVDDFYVV